MQEPDQVVKHVYSDKWTKRWRESLDKWLKIKEMHQKNYQPQLISRKMRAGCGYCEEFGVKINFNTQCIKCNLFQKKICRNFDEDESSDFIFWKLLAELRKDYWARNKEIIGSCIDKIITAIEEDDPSKVSDSA